MKLKKLTIDNIASIEHAEIDFDAAPLQGEHLFLITGETGSGKSTLIDCLCLALYGNTPRLDSMGRVEYESGNNEKIKTTDTKQLLRRGAVTASVTLTFDDNGGTPYIATWSIKRARKKLENNIMNPERTLRTEDGVMPPINLHKITEINAHISRLTGLDMNEFFRTVVLAQGKFAEFLNSSESEKAALLEKMTGTEVFARVGQKIFEVYRDKEGQRDNLRDLLADIVLLNEEQKAGIQADIAALTEQQTAARQQHDNAKKMVDWLNEKQRNEQSLARKRQDLEQHLEKTRQEDYVTQQQLVTDWETTIEARRELRDLNQAQQQITALMARQDDLQTQFDLLCAALQATIDDMEAKQRQADQISTFLRQEEANSAMYEAIKTIKSLMNQRQQEMDNVATFQQALEADQQRLPRLRESVEQSHQALQQQDGHVKQMQAQYAQLGIEGVNANKDAVTHARQALVQFKAMLNTITQIEGRMTGQQDQLAKTRHALEVQQALEQGKRALRQQAHDALEREKDWNTLIGQAHKSLHQGDVCPVCGNIIDRLMQPRGQQVIDQLRQQLQDADNELQQTLTAISTAQGTIGLLTRGINDLLEEQRQANTDRDKQWQLCRELLAQCGRDVDTMPDVTATDELIAALDGDLDKLNAILQEASVLNKQITAQVEQLGQLNQAHSQARVNLSQVVQSIKYQQEAIGRSNTALVQITAELDGLFTMSDWQERAKAGSEFVAQIEQRADTYRQLSRTLQQVENAIGLARAIIPAMQQSRAAIVGLEPRLAALRRVPQDLDEQWRQFSSRYIGWQEQIHSQQAAADRARQALDKYLEANPPMTIERLTAIDSHRREDIDDIKRQQQQLAELITLTRGEIASLEGHQGEIAARQPDMSEHDPKALEAIIATCQQQCEELTGSIAERLALLSSDDEKRRTAGQRQRELEAAQAEFEQWHAFNEMLGDSTGSKFRKIALSYILGELLACANGYLRHFNNRYSLEAKPGSLTILVRDQMQGDLTSTGTLSGGEAFMVSLALALALSGTTGKMFSMDTLFIDEGFGALSGNYLDRVMETLGRLYDMGGKRVGIISHVELLKERVATQIQVTRDPTNATASQVHVVG